MPTPFETDPYFATTAGLVILTARHSPSAGQKDRLTQVARELPFVKRLQYNRKTISAIDATDSIKTTEIIGHLDHASFPSRKFWIEGPPPSFYDGKTFVRYGAFVVPDRDRAEFSFQLFLEDGNAGRLKEEFAQRGLNYNGYVLGNRALGGFTDIVTTVSMLKGIQLDDDTIMKRLHMTGVKTDHRVEPNLDLIDVHYQMADWLARFFVTLGSPFARHDVNWEKTPAELAEEKRNRDRMRINREPRLSLAPIEIDLARRDGKAAPKDEVQAARELLGKTTVRESQPVRRPDGSLWLRKRDGKSWTRKPHERKIASPVDRTEVGYVVTATRNPGMEIGPAGPVRRLDQPSS